MNPTHNPPTVDDTSVGPCWSDFCIASFCDGVHHVDATGYTWTEVRPDRATIDRLLAAVDVDSTPAGVLRGAAQYLHRHGWTQGVLYATTAICTPPACVLGAISVAAFGELVLIPDKGQPGWREYRQAADALHDHLPLPCDGDGVDFTIGGWNDTDGRTAEEVMAALLAAADEWEAQQTPPGGESR